MEALIDQDFEFNQTSLVYGQFLQEVHETCPGSVLTVVSHHYPYIANRSPIIHAATPESLAVVLKLRFGAHLRHRPPPPTEEQIAAKKHMHEKQKYHEVLMEKERYLKEIRMVDYLDILKEREYINLKDEAFYDSLKKMSIKNFSKDWLKDLDSKE